MSIQYPPCKVRAQNTSSQEEVKATILQMCKDLATKPPPPPRVKVKTPQKPKEARKDA